MDYTLLLVVTWTALLSGCLSAHKNSMKDQVLEDIDLTVNKKQAGLFVGNPYVATCSFNLTNYQFIPQWRTPWGSVVSSNSNTDRVHSEDRRPYQLMLVFLNIEETDVGNYTCSILNGTTVLSSVTFELVVIRPIKFIDRETEVIRNESEDAILRCEVTGDPIPLVTWRVKDTPYTEKMKPHIEQLADGLLIRAVNDSDAGNYTCMAFQKSEHPNIKYRVMRLRVKHEPRFSNLTTPEVHGYIGGYVNITCAVRADPAAKIDWRRVRGSNNDGEPIDFRNDKEGSSTKHKHASGDVLKIKDEPNMSIIQIYVTEETFKTTFWCYASNNLGMDQRNFRVLKGLKPVPPKKVNVDERDSSKLTLVAEVDTNRKDVLGLLVNVSSANESWYQECPPSPCYVTKLTPDTQYTVRVATRALAGVSEYSAPLTARTAISRAPARTIESAVPTTAILLLVFPFSTARWRAV